MRNPIELKLSHQDQEIGALEFKIDVIEILNSSPKTTFDRTDIGRILFDATKMLRERHEKEKLLCEAENLISADNKNHDL